MRFNSVTYILIFMVNELVQEVTCDVFSSLTRIKDMVLNERQILARIRRSVPSLMSDGHSEINRLYEQRLASIMSRNLTHEMEKLNHPNGVYLIIKEFHDNYQLMKKSLADNGATNIEQIFTDVANDIDLEGARESLIRLQDVYELSTELMVKGNYLNYKGPELNPTDAFLVGKTAFFLGKFPQAVQWLTTAVDLLKQETDDTDSHIGTVNVIDYGQINFPVDERKSSILPDVMSLLGRSLLRVGERDKAAELYNKLMVTDRLNGDAIKLSHELDNLPQVENDFKSDVVKNFHRLCRLQSKTDGKSTDPRLRCRQIYILVPYFRFGEEIISNTPYVSIFYDVITDKHAETVKKETKLKLARGKIGSENSKVSSFRISHTAFINDHESEIARFISKRISYLTKLDAGPGAAEDHQIVNYGLGGYYTLHHDTYDNVDKGTQTRYVLDNFGNRLATFLIYLTGVERGGSTAFTEADLAVSPVKGQALFWYNLSPNWSIESLTRHAACPVVIGEKWIINKWILSYPNTFTRRCGLRQNLTQLDIQRDMDMAYDSKHRRKTFSKNK